MGLRPKEVQLAAESMAREAGGVLLAGADNIHGAVSTKTSAMDVVTSTDVAAEELIVARIGAAFLDDGILGEEGTSRAGSTGRRWIIDPLDGTSNFVRGWGVSVVSIGVEIDGELGIGVVYDPFRDELFSAATDAGAFRNGQRLASRTENTPLEEAFVGMVGGYQPWARAERAAVASGLLLGAGDLRYTGSSARDLCYVADGRLDACFGNGYSIWDLAAGAVIARETGCIVSGPVEGSVPTGDRMVAAIPRLMPAFRAAIQKGLDAAAGTLR